MVEPDRALPGRETEMPVPARHAVLGTPLKPPFPEGFEQAIVGMGCFWGAERVFWQAPGVYTTAVGYAGGITPNPTYEEVCSARTGHAEAVLVVFDPAKTSYEEILRLFWENHDPTQGMRQGNDVGTQYRSAIYWTTEEQRADRRGDPRRVRRSACARPATARSRPRSPRPDRSTTPRTTTSSTSRRTRGATAGSAGPASAARRIGATSPATDARAPATDRRPLRCAGDRHATRPKSATDSRGLIRATLPIRVDSGALSATARRQPPATAGRIVTSSPSATGVSSPSRKRMSSPPTYTLTNRRRPPSSAMRWRNSP